MVFTDPLGSDSNAKKISDDQGKKGFILRETGRFQLHLRDS